MVKNITDEDVKASTLNYAEIGAVCRTIERNNQTMESYITDISDRLESISRGDLDAVSSVEYVGDYASIKRLLMIYRYP